MSFSDNNKNRGAHGDSSFMLGGLPSSSENPPALAVGSVKSSSMSAKTESMINAEDIWSVIRHQQYLERPEPKDHWTTDSSVYIWGKEPAVKIEEVEHDV